VHLRYESLRGEVVEVTEGLEGFVEVVAQGSVTSAARSLGVPRPTLSRQLARLEDRMGVRLLHRSTRRLVLTRAGEELLPRARRIVDDARAALDAVRRHDNVPRGRLRVTVPPAHDGFLAAPLASFAIAYPAVSLEIEATSRVVDLVAEGFDLALRGGASAPPDHVRRMLLRTPSVAVASPAYLDRAGRPLTPEDLAAHALVLGVDATGAREAWWPLLPTGRVRVAGTFVANDVVLRRGAAEAGLGIALVPSLTARAALATGALEVVLPGVLGQPAGLALVYPERALLLPAVRAFVDHLTAWAAGLPDAPVG
jgi:DNA-binding transcriptional LysR family regulator